VLERKERDNLGRIQKFLDKAKKQQEIFEEVDLVIKSIRNYLYAMNVRKYGVV